MNVADDETPNQFKDRKFKIKAEDLTSKSWNWIRTGELNKKRKKKRKKKERQKKSSSLQLKIRR